MTLGAPLLDTCELADAALFQCSLKLTLNTYPHARLNQGGEHQSTEVGRTAGETYLRGKSRSENTVEADKTFDTINIKFGAGGISARCDGGAMDYMHMCMCMLYANVMCMCMYPCKLLVIQLRAHSPSTRALAHACLSLHGT